MGIDEIISREIIRHGALPFERFMELALYCPLFGYYEKEGDTPGKRGDFFTSVSVGELFGELLAFQFAEWLGPLRSLSQSRDRVRIAEAGAHDGRLAKDILSWMRERRPEIFSALEYCIVEPSARRREWQEQTLRDFSGSVRWVQELSALKDPPASGFHGIIFSNELLDAMPVQRFGWDAGQRAWFEWGVALDKDRLVWSRMPDERRVDLGLELPRDLLEVLPDGFTVETSRAAEQWWHSAAEVLARGKLLTFDYGFVADEFLSPERKRGTLRAYSNHRIADDVLANAGKQDITAHVNFTAIQRAGESAGLKTDLFSTQAKFLTKIAERAWQADSNCGE